MLKFSEIFEFSRESSYFERIRMVRMVRMVRSLADRTFQLCLVRRNKPSADESKRQQQQRPDEHDGDEDRERPSAVVPLAGTGGVRDDRHGAVRVRAVHHPADDDTGDAQAPRGTRARERHSQRADRTVVRQRLRKSADHADDVVNAIDKTPLLHCREDDAAATGAEEEQEGTDEVDVPDELQRQVGLAQGFFLSSFVAHRRSLGQVGLAQVFFFSVVAHRRSLGRVGLRFA